MTEDTNNLSILLSGTSILVALLAFYIGRSLWIARREWPQCSTDTKVLYLLVAPVLTLAVDVLEFTDKLFWSRTSGKTVRGRPAMAVARVRAGRGHGKPAMRSNG